jgi:N-acetylmuramoyl-L-alanine amidase
MALDGLTFTKFRLIGEAVRHNVEGSRHLAKKPALHLSRALPLSLIGALLIACLLYPSLPGTADDGVPNGPAGRSARAARMDRQRVASLMAPQRIARAVLPLSIKRIVIDPGHGGAHWGTVARSGAMEKDITLDLALRLRRLLQDASFEVLLTRESDVTMSLEERVAFANARRADVFVSIHVNSFPRRDVRPVETYHVGPSDDPVVLKLAGAENKDSRSPLGDYRRLIEKIYIDERRDESRAFAGAINAELFRALSAINPDIENRGVKMAPFAVLVGTEMPAILVEVSCLSNEEEAQLLTTDDYRAQIATALLRGIRSYVRRLDGVIKTEG